MINKGFTLVELLAIIIILSLLSLIASSAVGTVVKDSQDDLSEAEIGVIKEAAKTWGVENSNELPSSGECIYFTLKDLKDFGLIDSNIKNPKTGKKFSNNMKIKISSKNSKKGKEVLNYEVDVKDVSGCHDAFKPLCTANTTKATALVWQGNDDPGQESSYLRKEVGLLASTDGAYTSGVAYTCNFIDDSETNNMTFFVLSSTEETVTLIAGFNLKATSGDVHTVAWSADGNNHKDETEDKQALTAKKTLLERTSNWSSKKGGNLSDAQMSTIKLPTAYELAKAIHKTFSGSSISGLPTWLTSHSKAPVSYGYWTSTPVAESSSYAWDVGFSGDMGHYGVGYDSRYGVRPVITLPKNRLK